MIRTLRRSIEMFLAAALCLGAALLAAPEAPATGDDAAGKGTAAAEQADARAKTPQPTQVTRPASARAPTLVYRPPGVGKPAHSVGGGSRGVSTTLPQLFAAAPDHVGQTVSAEPSLYWYVNPVPDASIGIEFTLLDEESVDPAVETAIARPERPGLHAIRLSDYGARLQPGTEYQWSVALVIDPEERSKDIVATAFIDRIEPNVELTARLAEGTEAGAAAVYAEQGIWYDALAALSQRIESDPSNVLLQQQRADLLRQVGLEAAAEGAAP